MFLPTIWMDLTEGLSKAANSYEDNSLEMGRDAGEPNEHALRFRDAVKLVSDPAPPKSSFVFDQTHIHNTEVFMVSIASLWLPILLSAAFVFVLSSLVHMVFRYHSNDLRKLPDEDAVADALRKMNIPAGEYILPHAAGTKEMSSPEFQEKVKRGPGVLLTIWPGGRPSMAGNLMQWFLYSVVISIFSAYVASRALEAGAHYLAVFRFAGVTAFACYAVGGWQDSIWFKRAWARTLRNTIDGLLYALVTAGTFGWLWPR